MRPWHWSILTESVGIFASVGFLCETRSCTMESFILLLDFPGKASRAGISVLFALVALSSSSRQSVSGIAELISFQSKPNRVLDILLFGASSSRVNWGAFRFRACACVLEMGMIGFLMVESSRR
jgi:hypothetical protein